MKQSDFTPLIDLAFLCAALGASQLIQKFLNPSGFRDVLHESLLIGGWVGCVATGLASGVVLSAWH